MDLASVQVVGYSLHFVGGLDAFGVGFVGALAVRICIIDSMIDYPGRNGYRRSRLSSFL